MGPEGFHRRLAGKLNESMSDISLEPTRFGFNITSQHGDLVYRLGQNSQTITLVKGHTVSIRSDDDQAYDFTVSSSNDRDFIRQFAGRLPRALSQG